MLKALSLNKVILTYLKIVHLEVIVFSKFSHENLPSHVTVITPKEFSIKEILSEVAKLGIQSVYVEGGPNIHDQFLASE